MREAGQDQVADLAGCAVVGLWEVVRYYPVLRRMFHKLVKEAIRHRPDLFVLVDYPGFNLRFAQALRRLMPEARIAYYISPQLWAWRAGRARILERTVDLVLVIFPFEATWFQKHSPRLPVVWVGHPFVDRYQHLQKIVRPGGPLRIALLPGSRVGEIGRHLPLLLQVATELSQKLQRVEFVWVAPDKHRQRAGEKILERWKASRLVLYRETGELFRFLGACDLALVASGSASLECALATVPQLVFYQVHPLTYFIGKLLVRVPYVSMVNLVAGERIVPEFLQNQATAEVLVQATLELLANPTLQERMKQGMREVGRKLGPPGASRRAAQWLWELVQSRDRRSLGLLVCSQKGSQKPVSQEGLGS